MNKNKIYGAFFTIAVICIMGVSKQLQTLDSEIDFKVDGKSYLRFTASQLEATKNCKEVVKQVNGVLSDLAIAVDKCMDERSQISNYAREECMDHFEKQDWPTVRGPAQDALKNNNCLKNQEPFAQAETKSN